MPFPRDPSTPPGRFVPGSGRHRTVSAAVSAAILVGLGAVLVVGLRPPPWQAPAPSLVAVSTAPDVARPPVRRPPSQRPPPPRPSSRHRLAAAPRDTAGAPAPRASATALVAHVPRIELLPLPLVVATRAGAGADAASGAADSGTGSGAAGTGSGTGGGGSGGTGDGSGIAAHARQVKGRLSPRDVPDGLIPPGGQVSVAVRFTITPEGRATACRVTRSSGSAAVDAVPCPLLETRYRFRPARDRSGQPTAETLEETHTWFEPDRQ